MPQSKETDVKPFEATGDSSMLSEVRAQIDKYDYRPSMLINPPTGTYKDVFAERRRMS